MPAIRDMGIRAFGSNRTPDLFENPATLIALGNLIENQRARRANDAYRERALLEGSRRFDETAARQDRQLDLRERSFNRDVQGDLATGDYLDYVAAEMGIAERENPLTGSRYSDPEVWRRFQAMPPESKRETFKEHISLMQQEAEQKQLRDEQVAAKNMLNGFSRQLSGWTEGGLIPEQDAAMLGQRMADAISGTSGEKPYQVRKDAVKLMEHGAELTRREEFAANVLNSTLPMLNAVPALRSRLLSGIASYTAGGDGSMGDSDVLRLQADLLDQLRQPTPQDLAGAIATAVPGARPEAAEAVVQLRGAGIPIGVGDANLTGNQRQAANPGQKEALDTLLKRSQDVTIGKDNQENAWKRYKALFKETYGIDFPDEGEGGPAGDPESVRPKVGDIAKRLQKSLGRKPSPEELAEELRRSASGGG